MKRILTSTILIAVIIVLSLPAQAGARFPDNDREAYYGVGYWREAAFNTRGIYGENYIYDQYTHTALWQEFCAVMEDQLILVGWRWSFRPTVFATTGYYQYGSGSPRHFVRWKSGRYAGTEVAWYDYPALETHRDYFILGFGYGQWKVYIDGMERKSFYFSSELSYCRILGQTSVGCGCSHGYTWYDELKQCLPPYGWLPWDAYYEGYNNLKLYDNKYVVTYKVNGHCFGTFKSPTG